MSKTRVGIIFGGMSSEREVSLNSGRNVYDNLDGEWYEGIPIFMDGTGSLWVIPWDLISQNTTIDITDHLPAKGERISYEDLPVRIDFAFLSLHGKYGDDGCIQGALEILGIPYTGPGVLASALGMDKHLQQMVLRASGILVPDSVLVQEREWKEDAPRVMHALMERFSFPFSSNPHGKVRVSA